MTHRKQFGTLLAVTLASTPAVAGPHHASHSAAPIVEVASTPSRAPTPPKPAATPGELTAVHHFVSSLASLVGMASTRPRTLPTGAPACGNVVSKAPRPRECRTVTTASTPPATRNAK